MGGVDVSQFQGVVHGKGGLRRPEPMRRALLAWAGGCSRGCTAGTTTLAPTRAQTRWCHAPKRAHTHARKSTEANILRGARQTRRPHYMMLTARTVAALQGAREMVLPCIARTAHLIPERVCTPHIHPSIHPSTSINILWSKAKAMPDAKQRGHHPSTHPSHPSG